MTALLWVAGAYLLLGCIGAALIRWEVQQGCPVWAIVWTVACAAVVTPVVCVRHRIMPWRLTMALERYGP